MEVPTQKNSAFTVLLALIALGIVVCGAYYFYQRQQQAVPEVNKENQMVNPSIITTTTHEDVTMVENQAGVSSTIRVEADVTQTVNCGSETCFIQKFAACEPATLTADTGFAGASYTIVGPVNGGCSMIFRYTNNPNPDWANKDMTCTFDNKLQFEQSIEKTFNSIFDGSGVCKGPLYTTMLSAS